MAKVIIYLRVSREGQEVANQLPSLQKWITERGHELVAMYQEEASAWASGHQRELSRLMADLPKYQPHILLIWALDRLTRQGVGTIFQLMHNFKVHGVRVISYQEPWTESPGPMGDVLYAIAAWVAEFESGRISRRTREGLARVRASKEYRQGKKHLGRPKGAKDKKKRKRTGYLLRYANKK